MKKKTVTALITIIIIALALPLAAEEGPHFYIVLSRDRDSYLTSLFIKEYLSTFAVDSEIRRSIDGISRDEVLRSGHPLSLRFWYQEDKVMLRSEDLRTGDLYFISGEYGRKVDPADNRAWLTGELNSLMWDLYLDGLIDQDPRMRSAGTVGEPLRPVIFIEKGFGEAARWEGFLRDALIGAGLDARLTEDSSAEVTAEDERPFSLRLWMLTEFMEVSLFDLKGDGDGGCYYLDTEPVREGEEMESYLTRTAGQISRLMENDRSLITVTE